MLFDFGTIEQACRTVSSAIAAGIVPAAMEIMDRHTTELVGIVAAPRAAASKRPRCC